MRTLLIRLKLTGVHFCRKRGTPVSDRSTAPVGNALCGVPGCTGEALRNGTEAVPYSRSYEAVRFPAVSHVDSPEPLRYAVTNERHRLR
jgi:hypothetical protein